MPTHINSVLSWDFNLVIYIDAVLHPSAWRTEELLFKQEGCTTH
jgi:hypothetical protein